MLNESKIKYLESCAKEVLEEKIKYGEDAEIVYVPIVLTKDKKGNVNCVTDFSNKII